VGQAVRPWDPSAPCVALSALLGSYDDGPIAQVSVHEQQNCGTPDASSTPTSTSTGTSTSSRTPSRQVPTFTGAPLILKLTDWHRGSHGGNPLCPRLPSRRPSRSLKLPDCQCFALLRFALHRIFQVKPTHSLHTTTDKLSRHAYTLPCLVPCIAFIAFIPVKPTHYNITYYDT
jgi:hypothetical protein